MTRIAIVAAAVLPAMAAVVVALVVGADPGIIVRLVVTAFVYAPVALLAASLGRRDVALIAGSLAVTSGWLALFVMLDLSTSDSTWEAVVRLTLHIARLPELAALGLIPWLVASRRPSRVAIGFGLAPVVLSALTSLAAPVLTIPQWLGLVPLAWALTSFVVGAVALARATVSRGPRERTALSWFAAGVVLLVVSYGRVMAPLPDAPAMLADALFVLAQGFLPVGILAALVARDARSPDPRTIDGIAWAQSLAFGLSAYLAVTAATRAVGIDAALAGALAAAALALVLGGTIRAVRGRLGTAFAANEPDARVVLSRLGRRIADGPPIEGVRGIAESLRETWHVASVEIRLSSASSVSAGVRAPEEVTASLVSGGEHIGTIALTSPSREVLDRTVRPVLDQTVGLIAVAVQLAMVNEDVAATRARTLDVRREERRLLHAELHDRLAPSLAGIGFGMAAADALIAAHEARAGSAIAELRDQVAASTEEVRMLARAFLPTALDQGDLEGALAELVASAVADGTPVWIAAHGTDVLDANQQLALYLMLAEAIGIARRSERVRGLAASVSLHRGIIEASLTVEAPDDAARAIHHAVRMRARELSAEIHTRADSTVVAVIPR